MKHEKFIKDVKRNAARAVVSQGDLDYLEDEDEGFLPDTIVVSGIELHFDADSGGTLSPEDQASKALDAVNRMLQEDVYGLGAQLIYDPAGISVEKR